MLQPSEYSMAVGAEPGPDERAVGCELVEKVGEGGGVGVVEACVEETQHDSELGGLSGEFVGRMGVDWVGALVWRDGLALIWKDGLALIERDEFELGF